MEISYKMLLMLCTLFFLQCGKPVQKTDPAHQVINQNDVELTVQGIVKSVQNGKDGYTAELQSGQKSYLATISRANLDDPHQYRSVAIGDSLSVSGDIWNMDGKQHLTVREIID